MSFCIIFHLCFVYCNFFVLILWSPLHHFVSFCSILYLWSNFASFCVFLCSSLCSFNITLLSFHIISRSFCVSLVVLHHFVVIFVSLFCCLCISLWSFCVCELVVCLCGHLYLLKRKKSFKEMLTEVWLEVLHPLDLFEQSQFCLWLYFIWLHLWVCVPVCVCVCATMQWNLQSWGSSCC